VTVKRAIVLAVLASLAAVVAAADGRVTVLEFPRFNGTFRDMAPEIAPVSSGGLTIKLSSPANSLTIRSHSLELEPLGDSRHRFRGRIDFLGKADLIAELDSKLPGSVEDQVLLPTQEIEIEGEVDFVKRPGGYDITTRKLPTHADLAMQSRLGIQLVNLCDMLSILSGGDCSGLDAAFGRVRLPLPPPGKTFFLSDEDLTVEERLRLDDYLASAR